MLLALLYLANSVTNINRYVPKKEDFWVAKYSHSKSTSQTDVPLLIGRPHRCHLQDFSFHFILKTMPLYFQNSSLQRLEMGNLSREERGDRHTVQSNTKSQTE